MVIELCETNEASRMLPEIRAALPDADVAVHACMSRCAGCFLCLFAFVDGELVESWDPADFMKKLKAFL